MSADATKLRINDRLVLAGVGFALVNDLAPIDPVLQHQIERAAGKMLAAGHPSAGGIDFYRGAHSIHLGNVGEIWPLSLVAFLRADSNSCAVFAAATIEFIGVFNV